jgi:hypothetical protein
MGQNCVVLRNATIAAYVTRSVGPRILWFGPAGGENVLAELPHVTLDCPGVAEKFVAYGGHRLWHAPQAPARTHLPDNRPVEIRAIEHGVEAIQAVEERTGLQKSMRVTLPDDGAGVVVDHTLTNHGLWPVETAPWAITQLPDGGVGICPQTDRLDDPTGAWPNRSIALWPFTDIASPHIRWGNRFILVVANMQEGMLKFGFPNPDGWLAYWRANTLFVKHAAFQQGASYFDRGSSSHVFCTPGFIELETLGPRTVLPPGGATTHRERWTMYSDVEFEPTEPAAAEIVRRLQL